MSHSPGDGFTFETADVLDVHMLAYTARSGEIQTELLDLTPVKSTEQQSLDSVFLQNPRAAPALLQA